MQIYLYIFLIGLLITSYLIYFNLKRNSSILYLGAFFFFMSLYSLNNFIIYRSHSEFWISIFYVNLGHFAYLIGPLSYLYVRSILNDNSKLKKIDICHFAPFILSLLFSIPYIFTNFEYKKEIARQIASNYEYLITYHPTILSYYFSNFAIYISRPIQILAYTVLNFILIYKYKLAIHQKPTSEMVILRWLITYNIFQAFVVLSYSVALYIHFIPDNLAIMNFIPFFEKATLIGLLLLMLSPTLFPRILYGLPIENLETHDRSIKLNEFKASEKASMKSVVFDEIYLESVFIRIEEFMNIQHLYLQTKLNLKVLSETLEIPEYHLKYLFSTYKNISFKDYCDRYRIEHAKRLIKDPKYSNMTMEAIALSSGFANRNSFTKSFQKFIGKNPRDYNRVLK